jgi:asparagine synthase (glutamine-hydrolysing)
VVAFVAFRWSGDPPPVLVLVRSALAGIANWRAAVDEAGLLLAVRGPHWPRVRRLPAGRGWVVGDLHRQSFGPVAEGEVDHLMISQVTPPTEIADRLCDTYWGRYVALIDPGGAGEAVFRDPSGAVDALTWRASGLSFAGSHMPDWLPSLALPDLSFDWAVIGRWLVDGSAAAVTSGLAGVRSVTPGALALTGRPEVQVWRPAAFARRAIGPVDQAADVLPGLLDRCVAAATADAPSLAAEISGGLDSAILASSLAGGGVGRVKAWMNYYAAEGSGDERAYARDVAALWGVTLTEVVKARFVYDADKVETTATGLRPGFHALDAGGDADIAARLAALGADRMVSGQGGDMVLFNLPTGVVVADHLRRTGLRGLASPYVVEVARWTRQSVWRTLAQALHPLAAWPGEALAKGHPWMVDTAGLPPGKRAHIVMLAQKLTTHIENRRARQAEVLTPFLFQPILEHCLAIPVPDLTVGGRDRGLARRAFADRLPLSVLNRRDKGEFSAFYARVVGRSLEFLRPYLLDGRLAAQGLLDRPRFDKLLTLESLVWQADSAAIMSAVTVEAWLRVWARRAAGSSSANPR